MRIAYHRLKLSMEIIFMLSRSQKSSSFLQIKHQIYTKSRQINIASTYKKIPDKISNKVNADGKKIVENKEVVNRLFVNGRNSCFITLKDHKRHFLNNPKIP